MFTTQTSSSNCNQLIDGSESDTDLYSYSDSEPTPDSEAECNSVIEYSDSDLDSIFENLRSSSIQLSDDENDSTPNIWELFTGMNTQNFAKIKTLIDNDEDLLFCEDDEGSTVFHYAFFSSNHQIVGYLLDKLQTEYTNDCRETLSKKDDKGRTPLHIAAKHADYYCFALLTFILGEAIYEQAKQITKKVKLPLQIVDKNKNKDAKRIREQLEKFTIDSEGKKLDVPVDEQETYSTLTEDEKNNPILLSYLDQAIKAANFARTIISTSSTASICNEYDKQEARRINSVCAIARIEAERMNKHLTTASDPDHLIELENVCATAVKYKAGNCGEYSDLVIKALRDDHFADLAEIYSISNGDHAFVVIGRDRNSIPSDYRTWGANAVVIDAWAGQVYPAREIPVKLKDHFGYERKFANITFPVDLEFHRLRPELDMFVLNKSPVTSPASNASSSSLGLFAKKMDTVSIPSQSTSALRI